MIEHDCKMACLLYVLQGSYFGAYFGTLFAAIVITVRFQTSPDGEGSLYAEKWTIKCSCIKSGVFPFTLHSLQEGFKLIAYSLPKLWPIAQTENSHEELLSPPGIEGLIAPVANWRVFT